MEDLNPEGLEEQSLLELPAGSFHTWSFGLSSFIGPDGQEGYITAMTGDTGITDLIGTLDLVLFEMKLAHSLNQASAEDAD